MNTSKSILSKEIQIGAYTLPNRIIMAPLTRMRANEGELAPTDLSVVYYHQRASAGLIITEASQISQQAQGYPFTPGIYNSKQIEQWKKVTDRVHQENGHIFMQLWHVGRVSHSIFQPDHRLPVAPSSLPAEGNAFLLDFSRAPYETPRELEINEIKNIVEDYRQAAINAKEAGFDGVEIHGANGYLIEQFLRTVSNHRTDAYGGSIENRARFLFEVLEAILTVWSADKVGIRISPFYTGVMLAEPEPFPLYDYVVQKLENYNLAYLHIIESREATTTEFNIDKTIDQDDLLIKHFRKMYSHTIIAAGGFSKETAEQAIEAGYADAIAFGRPFISTPDLPFRLLNNIEINLVDETTVYGGGSKGYTDYPVYQ